MFVFEDIVTLDHRAIQRVIREVDNNDLMLALKVASDEVKNIIFRNMSTRMAETFKEEMEYMGPVRLRDVEEAQSRIVAVIRRLEEAGEIVIARGGEMILLSNVIKAPKLAARAGKKTIVVQRHVSDLPSSVDDRQREMEAVAAAKEEAAKLRRQAEQYYESVREQLAREKEEWQLEKERLMQEARARGYEDGYAAGREEALSEHRALIEQARRLAERANTEFYARIESTAEAMLEVALKVAERIIGAALEGDRNAFFAARAPSIAGSAPANGSGRLCASARLRNRGRTKRAAEICVSASR